MGRIRGIDTLSGETTLSKLFLLPFVKKVSTLKKKNAYLGTNIFFFSVDLFSERALSAAKQTGTRKRKVVFLINIM